jgi:hypothetical protein
MESTLLTQEEILLRALCEDGTDALIKYALADYYEGEGREGEAACMRWAATAGKRPFLGQRETWDWWSQESPVSRKYAPEGCRIPDWVMEYLPEGKWKASSGMFSEYDTAEQAWDALFQAWARKYSFTRVAV